jgi:8-oxo-dGTP diphosphatase
MKSAVKRSAPVQAAGGIVLRGAPEPLIAIVRLRKNKAWVLPKGKLKPGDEALTASRREAMEETGHDVSVLEFLGAMPNGAGGKPKITQFWRMQASVKPVGKLMRDVKAVKWLPLEQALAALTHGNERAFLAKVGPGAIEAARAAKVGSAHAPDGSIIKPIWAWLRGLMPRRR